MSLKFPPRRRPPLTVAIPASTVAEASHPREKTLKLGVIGRALAIFRVDRVIVYRDRPERQDEDLGFMVKVLSYMAAPQYLRKTLFPLTPELRFSGVLPPLRTPNHPTAKTSSEVEPGEYRQGVVIGREQEGSLVDVGLEKPALIRSRHPLNRMVNVRILKVGRRVIEAEEVDEREIPYYWGFKVEAVQAPLDVAVRRSGCGLAIATSRYGSPIEDVAVEMVERWQASRGVLVAFGSPSEGIGEILSRRRVKPDEIFHYTVNTIRFQGVETVRVEEALLATLAILNYLVPG